MKCSKSEKIQMSMRRPTGAHVDILQLDKWSTVSCLCLESNQSDSPTTINICLSMFTL